MHMQEMKEILNGFNKFWQRLKLLVYNILIIIIKLFLCKVKCHTFICKQSYSLLELKRYHMYFSVKFETIDHDFSVIVSRQYCVLLISVC